jgi:hypothetical protein
MALLSSALGIHIRAFSTPTAPALIFFCIGIWGWGSLGAPTGILNCFWTQVVALRSRFGSEAVMSTALK